MEPRTIDDAWRTFQRTITRAVDDATDALRGLGDSAAMTRSARDMLARYASESDRTRLAIIHAKEAEHRSRLLQHQVLSDLHASRRALDRLISHPGYEAFKRAYPPEFQEAFPELMNKLIDDLLPIADTNGDRDDWQDADGSHHRDRDAAPAFAPEVPQYTTARRQWRKVDTVTTTWRYGKGGPTDQTWEHHPIDQPLWRDGISLQPGEVLAGTPKIPNPICLPDLVSYWMNQCAVSGPAFEHLSDHLTICTAYTQTGEGQFASWTETEDFYEPRQRRGVEKKKLAAVPAEEALLLIGLFLRSKRRHQT